MQLTPYQKKQIRFVLVLLLGIPATIFAVYKGVEYLSQATGDPTPEQVVISNVTNVSIVLSWYTQKEVEGYVIPVLDGVEKAPVADKRGAGKRLSHYVELRSLEPDTEYSFILMSDEQKYESGTTGAYKAKTLNVAKETPSPVEVHGFLEGSSIEDSIVYILFENKSAYPVSTVVSSSGSWMVYLYTNNIDDESIVKVTADTKLVLMGRKDLANGAVLEGTFSALFDSNRKLNQAYTFELGDTQNLISYFPPETVLGSASSTVIPVDDDDEDETPTPPPVQPDDDDEEIPNDDEPYSGEYTIKHDISWTDLVSESSSFNLENGEDTILVTNLTNAGFSVVWRSSEKEEGYVKYGTSKTALNTEVRDYRDGFVSMGKYNSHLIETERLESETTYYFEVYSGGKVYDNDGEKYSVTTFPLLSTAIPFETKSGQVLNATDPSDWVLVFKLIDNDEVGTLGSSGYLSTLPDEEGYWMTTIGDSRSEDGDSYFSFSDTDILQTFFVGADSKKFDYPLSQEDMEFDVLEIGQTTTSSSVKLLSDYGIIKLR
ncbi:hypothetical protein A2400_01300 [candidate division WS6 bacterium RIFOXYB1_FULL_33_14]|uniref:Fibronectin type-III domain-containing protein n=1 Tax=candidate division WS6 bacterium RIFOXYB1_FULL_33_14 TaxID=1817896 RepID=A0A1F4UFH4_9BACT|nr:MAG: hypothetical protein A2400_01300 [candidate division WS6 bacterium RIFOXYB1_FULL_33_14]